METPRAAHSVNCSESPLRRSPCNMKIVWRRPRPGLLDLAWARPQTYRVAYFSRPVGRGSPRDGLVSWLRHAFAVDPPGPAEPNELQRRLVDKVCGEVVRRRLTTP